MIFFFLNTSNVVTPPTTTSPAIIPTIAHVLLIKRTNAFVVITTPSAVSVVTLPAASLTVALISCFEAFSGIVNTYSSPSCVVSTLSPSTVI